MSTRSARSRASRRRGASGSAAGLGRDGKLELYNYMRLSRSLEERLVNLYRQTKAEAGADPNIQLKRRPPYRNVPQDRGGDSILSQGATPLLRAARAGDAPFVALLLEHGALVDLPSNQGVTPLMAAAGVEFGQRVTRGRNRTDEGVLATMRLLLDAGADINARSLMDRRGDTAAHLLVIEQRLDDFTFNYRGRQVPGPRAVPHQTALHGAAQRGFNAFVEFLAENGADLFATDANGKTALDLAVEVRGEPLPETVALLERLLASAPAAERVASE